MDTGFMKHLPNLLKQESSSASTLVHVLLRMYHDTRPEHQAARPQIAERLVPYVLLHVYRRIVLILNFLCRLGVGVLRDFNKLKADTQSKNIAAWTPVVAETLEGFCRFDRQDVGGFIFSKIYLILIFCRLQFTQYLAIIYPLATDLLSRDISAEIRQPLKTYFERVGYVKRIVDIES